MHSSESVNNEPIQVQYKKRRRNHPRRRSKIVAPTKEAAQDSPTPSRSMIAHRIPEQKLQ